MLRVLLAWRGDDSIEEQLAPLEQALELAELKPAEALPLIAPLLSLPDAGEVSSARCPLSFETQPRRRLRAAPGATYLAQAHKIVH